jgi:hypothetical protein
MTADRGFQYMLERLIGRGREEAAEGQCFVKKNEVD